MILIGALLLAPTLLMRVKTVNELTSDAELVGDSSEDMEQTMQQVGEEQTHPRGERGRGKNKENTLVKSKGEAAQPGNGKVIRKSGEFPERKFRFPVLNGKWWIHRLAFMRGQFAGFVYQEVPATKTLLVKSWKAQEDFGDEVIIPLWGNYIGAKVGDKITFDVGTFAQEGEGKPRPMATNVLIREREHPIGTGLIMAPPPMDVRTQVLYYLSDDNLRTDKFFQDIIAATKGGWISTDFLLLCRRMKQLGASPKSIIESLRDAPGIEVRDIPGQEAIRRKKRSPPMEPGTIARKDVIFPTLTFAAKKMYAAGMMKRMGDLPIENHMEQQLGWKELWQEVEGAEVAGKEADKQERALGMADAKGPESSQDKSTMAKRAAKADKRKADAEARRAKSKASATTNEDLAKKAAVNKATAKKAAAEKPAAKKLGAYDEQAVEEQAAEEKAAALVKRSLQAAAERATEEAAAAPAASSDKGKSNEKSWGSWFSSWFEFRATASHAV